MAAPAGSILPDTYFEGLSNLWGACAYVASAIAATGFVLRGLREGWEPGNLIRLVTRLFFVGLATILLREWLIRLNDVVRAFADLLGVDPTAVDEKFVQFLAGRSPTAGEVSVWDVIWETGSIGTAICYALLWLFGWLSWGVQYIVNLFRDILLSAGWSLSPLFLSFFMLRTMEGVGRKYVIGLAALVCWPFGWAIAAVVTNAMLDAAAKASLIPIVISPSSMVAPMLTVLLIGAWMILSSCLAPYITMRMLLAGANPAAAFGQGVGGVAQAGLIGGVGAATAAVTGGASAAVAVTAAAAGAMAAGTESAARGGGFPQSTATAVGGMAGFYRGQFVRRQTSAMAEMASADSRRAAAVEAFTAQFSENSRQRHQRPSNFAHQPHHPDPNQAAIEIEAHAKS
ncbi:hypothetical protein [Opitutus terrae]|uniref:TrbL/VirB6 plasmid conjugal transfer protein n=1 Tax=Opitutus terrae (strain DSM 11246 / JCM 15787 / PB90-1) TaxID=452637 RepID=B1ZPH1_OPITP|nr:hypothetical protein [Opitutus terrae]ACB74490.1 hypothetical protein Oter_1204 [Opitutus terrae PB90-1]